MPGKLLSKAIPPLSHYLLEKIRRHAPNAGVGHQPVSRKSSLSTLTQTACRPLAPTFLKLENRKLKKGDASSPANANGLALFEDRHYRPRSEMQTIMTVISKTLQPVSFSLFSTI
jgi:hypothetical protein